MHSTGLADHKPRGNRSYSLHLEEWMGDILSNDERMDEADDNNALL